jgi:hypothetical protein
VRPAWRAAKMTRSTPTWYGLRGHTSVAPGRSQEVRLGLVERSSSGDVEQERPSSPEPPPGGPGSARPRRAGAGSSSLQPVLDLDVDPHGRSSEEREQARGHLQCHQHRGQQLPSELWGQRFDRRRRLPGRVGVVSPSPHEPRPDSYGPPDCAGHRPHRPPVHPGRHPDRLLVGLTPQTSASRRTGSRRAEEPGSGGETRTLNLAVNSRLLCRLSYPGPTATKNLAAPGESGRATAVSPTKLRPLRGTP